MLSLLTLQQECVRAYRRYADTVAVLSAVYHVLKEEPRIADYVGIESKLRNSYGKDIRPDLVVLCESRTKGLLFEFKWSLPFSEEFLEKEVREIKKYAVPCSQWRNSNGKVEYHDVVLVCHIEDAQRTISKLSQVSKEPDYDFLASEGFALWTWTISAARGGERKEHLIIANAYGKTRNATIENMIDRPAGLILPEEVLTYLRSSFTFIREKPPVQYTMIALIQHIFSQFQDPTRGRAVYEITTDMVYEKANIFFPGWHEFDLETIQAKRSWITEALQAMFSLNMISKPVGKTDSWLIPIPTMKTRKPIQFAICRKLSKNHLKITKRPARRGRPRTKPIRIKAHPKMKRINDYF